MRKNEYLYKNKTAKRFNRKAYKNKSVYMRILLIQKSLIRNILLQENVNLIYNSMIERYKKINKPYMNVHESKYEDIFSYIGGDLGVYQLLIFLFLGLANLIQTFVMFNFIFAAATPEFRYKKKLILTIKL